MGAVRRSAGQWARAKGLKARDASAALQDDSGLKSALSSPLYCVWSRVRNATGCSPLLLAVLAWLVGSVAYGFCHEPEGPMVNGELLEEQLQRRIADIPVPHDSPQYAQYKQYYLRQYQQHLQEVGNAHAQWQQNRPRFNWNALQQALGAGVLVFAAALAYFEYHYGAICYFMEAAEEAWYSWRERLSKALDPLADSKKMERFLKEMGEEPQPATAAAPSAPASPAAAPATACAAARPTPEPRKRPTPPPEAKPQLPETPEPPRRHEPPVPTPAEPPQPLAGTATSEVPTVCDELPAHTPAPGGAANPCARPAPTDPAPAETAQENLASEAAEPTEDTRDVGSSAVGPAADSAQQPAQPAHAPQARAAAGRPFPEAPPANVRERLRRKVVERHREQIRAVVTQASVPRFAAPYAASSAVAAAEAAQARLRVSAPAPASAAKAAANPGAAQAPAPPPLAGRELLREAEELLSQLEAEDLLRQLAGEEEKKRQARKKANKRKVVAREDKGMDKAGAAPESVCSTDLAAQSGKLDEMDTTTASDASVVDEGGLDGRDEATSHGEGEEDGAEGMAACTSGEEPAGRHEVEEEEEEEERERPAHEQAEASAVGAEPSGSDEAWSGAAASSAGGAAAAAAQAGQSSSEAAAAPSAAAAPPAGRPLLQEAAAFLRQTEQEADSKRLTRKQAKRKAVANANVGKAGVPPVRVTSGPRHSSFLEAAQKAVQVGAAAASDAGAMDKAVVGAKQEGEEVGGWHHHDALGFESAARALPPAMAAAYEPEMLYPPTPSSSCPGTPRCGAHDDPMAHAGFVMQGPAVDAMGMVYLPVPVYLVPQVHQFIDLMITDPNGPAGVAGQWGMLPGQFGEESCAPMSSEGLSPMLNQEGTPLW